MSRYYMENGSYSVHTARWGIKNSTPIPGATNREEALEKAKAIMNGEHKLHCLRCGAYWIPRKPNPVQCPRCKSTLWNKSRKE